MGKNILHFKFDYEESKKRKHFPQGIGNFINRVREIVGNEYVVIATPFEPSVLEGAEKIMNFDVTQLSKEEIERLVFNVYNKNNQPRLLD